MKSEIRLNGKIYKIEIINDQRFIDGKTINEFMKGCDPITLIELAEIGKKSIEDKKNGIIKTSYQKMADEFHQRKNN